MGGEGNSSGGKCARVLHHPHLSLRCSQSLRGFCDLTSHLFPTFLISPLLAVWKSVHLTILQPCRGTANSVGSHRGCVCPSAPSLCHHPPPTERGEGLAKEASSLLWGQTVDPQAFASTPKGAKISLLGHENQPLIPSHRTWMRNPLPGAVTLCLPLLGLKGWQCSSRKKLIFIA